MISSITWLRYVLYLLLASLVNPLVLIVVFALLWTNLSERVATNVYALPGQYIPVWILCEIIVFAIVGLVRFAIIRAFKRLDYAQFVIVDSRAQLAYLPFMVLALLLLFGDIEGNVMGFLVVPAFLVLVVITVPISLYITFRAVRRLRQVGE